MKWFLESSPSFIRKKRELLNIEETMTKSKISYFDVQHEWNDTSQDILIYGFELQETVPPMIVHHGDKAAYPWPWLLVFFHDEAFLNPGTIHEKECTGSLMIWRPGDIHCYGNELKKWNHSWLIVNFPEMEQLLNNWQIPTREPLQLDASRIFEKYLPLFLEELNSPSRDSFYLSSLMRLFLYDIYRTRKYKTEEIPAKIQKMAQFLEEQIRNEISMEEIAKTFGLSVPHFTALFRKYYHTPPMNYLYRSRMIHASRLLTFYSYSCKEVAEMCGFSDPLYFSKRFRQFWGISPREFRKQQINAPEDRNKS